MKVCSKCGIEKEFSEFHKCKKSKDGFKSACKECRKKDNKTYRNKNQEKEKDRHNKYREENKEEIRISTKNSVKKYRMNNPEKAKKSSRKSAKIYRRNNLEKVKAMIKNYQNTNRDKLLKKQKQYRDKNKNIISKKMKEYKKRNKEKIQANSSKRRATKLQCTPPWYATQKKEIEAIYKKADELSKSTGIKHHVDHIFPLVPKSDTDSVGLHILANLQILTEEENLKKSNMQPEEWEKFKKEYNYTFV